MASPSDRATRASTEPASSLGHSAGIPDALELRLPIAPEYIDANAAGEALLSFINDEKRWGYMTQDFLRGGFREVEGLAPLEARTICCGCWANVEGHRVGWWWSESLNLDVFLYWDGDGTIVFRHPLWTLENGDCKKSYGWEWVGPDHWSRDLPDGYYEPRQ